MENLQGKITMDMLKGEEVGTLVSPEQVDINSEIIKTYIAGSLFTEKEIEQRIKERKMLVRKLLDTKVEGVEYVIYNPIENDEINDKSKEVTAKSIYEGDVKQLLDSDFVLVDLDDAEKDPGVCAELGMCAGINIVLGVFTELLFVNPSANLRDAVELVLNNIAPKKIIAHHSDIRTNEQLESGIHKANGFNQFLIGLIETEGEIVRGSSMGVNKVAEQMAILAEVIGEVEV